MGSKLTWVVLFSAAIMVAAISTRGRSPPPATGFKATTIATGTFSEIDAFNRSSKNELPAGFDGDVWLSLQRQRTLRFVRAGNVWPAANPTAGR